MVQVNQEHYTDEDVNEDLSPLDSASFIFRLPDGTTKEVIFTSKPLGLDFQRVLPLKIQGVHPKSCAAQFGIQENWVLIGVKGQLMPMNMEDALKKVLQVVDRLPKGPALS